MQDMYFILVWRIYIRYYDIIISSIPIFTVEYQIPKNNHSTNTCDHIYIKCTCLLRGGGR